MHTPRIKHHPTLRRLLPTDNKEPDQIPITYIPDALWSLRPGGWRDTLRYCFGKLYYTFLHWTGKGDSERIPLHFMPYLWTRAWQISYDYWLKMQSGGQQITLDREGERWVFPEVNQTYIDEQLVYRLSEELLVHPLYRKQIKKSDTDLNEASQFALMTWLQLFLAEGEDPNAQEALDSLPSGNDRLHTACRQEARSYMKELITQAIHGGPRTRHQQLELLVRGLEVKRSPSTGQLSFQSLLNTPRGESLIHRVQKSLARDKRLSYLLQFHDIYADDIDTYARTVFDGAFEQELRSWARKNLLDDIDRKIPVINSLDKQVRNLTATFESAINSRWETLHGASKSLNGSGREIVEARIPKLEEDLHSFEGLVGRIGLSRLDVVDDIHTLQQLSEQIQTSSVAEQAMVDLINAHPAWSSEDHCRALNEQIYEDLRTLTSYCQQYSPGKQKPLPMNGLEHEITAVRRELVTSYPSATAEEQSIILERCYHSLNHLIMPQLPHYAPLHRSEITATFNLIYTLLLTADTFTEIAA